MIIAVFLAILAAALIFGGWLGARLTQENTRRAELIARDDELIARNERDDAICDAADMAETACDYGGLL